MAEKVTVPRIRGMRNREKIVCITAYDFNSGSISDTAGVDLILVGDSLGNVVLGYDSTIPVTMDQMVHHVRATRQGVRRALLVADMPFGSYGSSVAQAVDSAVILMKAGAEAVKLEGPYFEEIEAITKSGIPVMGHIGMTPQSVNNFGGHRVQGKGEASSTVKAQANDVCTAGAFAIVLELIPAALAAEIRETVSCPTIGIGAGAGCDGQIQVYHDALGLGDVQFKHAKAFANGRHLLAEGLARYAGEVRSGEFPSAEHQFS